MKLQFRPHHFLCALCFQGKGYSPAFIENFQDIMTQLHAEQGDNTPITVVSHTDSICQPCPHRSAHTCSTEEKIRVLDKAHALALGIKAGNTLTWGEAKKRIAHQISINIFHRICATCHWKEYGICENVLLSLTDKQHKKALE